MARDTPPDDELAVERREYMLGLGALAIPAAASSNWSFLPWVDDEEDTDGFAVSDDGDGVLSDLLEDSDGIDYGNNLTAELSDGTLMVKAANASVSGAPADASYVTTSTEDGLDNESVHSNLSGTDLHDPKSHGNEAHSATYIDGVDVQDDGAAVGTATTIDAGSSLSATDQGSGTVTLDASGGFTIFKEGTVTIGSSVDTKDVTISTSVPSVPWDTAARPVSLPSGAEEFYQVNASDYGPSGADVGIGIVETPAGELVAHLENWTSSSVDIEYKVYTL